MTKKHTQEEIKRKIFDFRRNLEGLLNINEFCCFDNELVEIKCLVKNKTNNELSETTINFNELEKAACG